MKPAAWVGRLSWAAAMLLAERAVGGVWGVDPVIGLTGDYATNPVLVDAPNTREANAALLLDAPLTYNADAARLSLLPSLRIGDTRGYSSVTSDYEHLNAKAEFDSERGSVAATLGAARDSSLYYNYLSNGTVGVRRDSALADLAWDRFLTERVEFNADANASRVRYGQSTGVGTLVDYRYLSIAPTLAWNTVERNRYTLAATVGRYNSLNGATESRSGNLQLGFVRQLTEQWTLTASGGYSRALNSIESREATIEFTPQGPIIVFIPVRAESSQNGSVYSVEFRHQGSRLLLTGTASRQILPTGFAFLSRQQTLEFKASYAWSARWTLGADLRQVDYHNPEASGHFYDVKVPYASVNANWAWTENWTVALSASRVREAVLASTFDQRSSEVTLTLTRRFNHIALH